MKTIKIRKNLLLNLEPTFTGESVKYLLGKNRRGVVERAIRLQKTSGCAYSAGISSYELTRAYIQLNIEKYKPFMILDVVYERPGQSYKGNLRYYKGSTEQQIFRGQFETI
jgi:hypothetical protein